MASFQCFLSSALGACVRAQRRAGPASRPPTSVSGACSPKEVREPQRIARLPIRGLPLGSPRSSSRRSRRSIPHLSEFTCLGLKQTWSTGKESQYGELRNSMGYAFVPSPVRSEGVGAGGEMTAAAAPFGAFLDAAMEVCDSAAASVQAYDAERGGLRLEGWRGFHPLSARFWDLVVPESASTCGMALVSGERVVVPDLEAEAALAGSEDLREYRRSRLRAVQSTPLVADDGRVVGMLSTHWRTPHEPSAAVLRRIDSLARMCASAVAADQVVPEETPTVGALLLHEVNQRIRELAAQFDSAVRDDGLQEYLCECGCGTWVALTGREFDARIEDRRPVTAQGHVLARAQAARKLSRGLRNDAAALRAEARQRHRKSDELARRKPKPPPE